jgi:insulysin
VNAMLSLMHHLLREPAFNQLRTEESLGYIVHTAIKTSGDRVKGLLIVVQGDAFDPIHMEGRIEAFLEAFRTKLVALSSNEFQENVESVYQNLTEKSKNLGEESTKYWNACLSQDYNFLRLNEIADHCKALTKIDILRFFDRYILASSPFRRKLSVQVFGKECAEKMVTAPTDLRLVISDPREFISTQSLFSVQPTVMIDDRKLSIE